MTTFSKDSLQDQISRGEVFFGLNAALNQSQSVTNEWVIETGSNNCSMTVDFITAGNVLVSLYEGVSSISPTTVPENMNRESANTVAVRYGNRTFSGGTVLYGFYFLNGKVPQGSPFNSESGIILKPNTKYGISILNDSGKGLSYSMSYLFRENA